MRAGVAGYSGKPLAQKLGLRDGQSVVFIDLPDSLAGLMAARAFASVERIGRDGAGIAGSGYDVVHLFTRERVHLDRNLTGLRDTIAPDGMIWVSWPKKASKIVTDMSEDVVREVCLPIGLVDVKVYAVDEVWSGLKLVIRKQLR